LGDLTQALIEIAKAHYNHKNDLSVAEEYCSRLLRMNLEVEEASMLLSKVLVERTNFISAVHHIRQVFEVIESANSKKKALSQTLNTKQQQQLFDSIIIMIEISRRCNRLSECEKYIKDLEEHFGRENHQVLLCNGLYQRYCNKPNEALKCFNISRRHIQTKEESIYQMIDIFLNPDNDIVGTEVLDLIQDQNENGGLTEAEQQDTEMLSIAMAEKLLKDLPGRDPKPLKQSILEIQVLMATKQKPMLEQAMMLLQDLMIRHKGDISVNVVSERVFVDIELRYLFAAYEAIKQS
jgi:tetratricopeptide repeat protein 21B